MCIVRRLVLVAQVVHLGRQVLSTASCCAGRNDCSAAVTSTAWHAVAAQPLKISARLVNNTTSPCCCRHSPQKKQQQMTSLTVQPQRVGQALNRPGDCCSAECPPRGCVTAKLTVYFCLGHVVCLQTAFTVQQLASPGHAFTAFSDIPALHLASCPPINAMFGLVACCCCRIHAGSKEICG